MASKSNSCVFEDCDQEAVPGYSYCPGHAEQEGNNPMICIDNAPPKGHVPYHLRVKDSGTVGFKVAASHLCMENNIAASEDDLIVLADDIRSLSCEPGYDLTPMSAARELMHRIAPGSLRHYIDLLHVQSEKPSFSAHLENVMRIIKSRKEES